ncbi:MAG: O-antigen ligase family protein [Vulcanibacillus sp.]
MVNTIFAFAYLIVIYASFLFRGSFFQYEQTIFAFAVLVIFLFWLIKKYINWDDYTFNYQDGLFMLIIVGYVIGLINSVDSIGAWKELYLIIIYFFVYLMGKDLFFAHKRLLVGFLLFLTTSLSIVGLLAYFGFELPFSVLYLGNRIGSLLQYPNTLAVINIIGIVTMLGLILFSKSIIVRTTGFLVFIVNLLTLMLTISRGGFLVIALILVIFLLLLPNVKKITYILFNGLGLAIILFFSRYFISSFGKPSEGLQYLTILLITSVVLFIILDYLLSRINFSNKKVYMYGIIAIVFSGVLLIYFGYQLIPETILVRIKDINFSTSSVKLRFDFYEAAWGIIKDYPLGIGGEGWASFYYDYIKDFIIAREVHSHPLQVGVEAGFIGMVAFILFSLVAIYRFIKNYFIEESDTRYYYLILGLSFMVLFTHSLIDFDLSFTSVSFLFYLLASQTNRTNSNIKFFNKYNTVILGVFLILSVYLIYGLGTMLVGSHYKVQGEKLLEQNQYVESVVMFENATRWMPKDSMSYLYVTMFKEGITSMEKEYLLEKAYKYNSYNPEIIHYYIKELLTLERYEDAYTLSLPLVKRQPVKENFVLFFESSRYCMKEAVTNEDKLLLEKYSATVLDACQLSNEYNYRLREVDNLVLGQAYFIVQDYQKAEEQLMLANKNNFIKVESEMWLIVLYEKDGEIDKANSLLNKPLNRLIPKNDNFLHLRNIF